MTERFDPIRGGRRGELVAEFWRRLQAGAPAFQRCTKCSSFRFPPGFGCPSCGSTEFEWVPAETEPEVVAWTVTHPAAASRLPKKLLSLVPYVLVLLRFPDIDSVFLPALMSGDEIGHLFAGAHAELGGGTEQTPRLTAKLVNA